MANQIKKKYIQDAAIDGEKLELLEGQSVKLKKDGGEVVNLLQLNQEDKILLKGEEAALKSQVDAEQERAEGEESRIEGKVDQEVIDRQDAVSQEEAARIAGDESLDGRLSPIEEILEYNKSVIYESNSSVFADGAKGKEDQNLREGWYYTNDGSDLGLSGDNKINWYFFDGQQNQVSLSDFSGYAVMTFDDNSESPILSVYTFPTGSGDATSWYHSRVNYSGFSEQPEVGKQYLVYFGQDPQIHPELPRLEINKSNNTSVGDQEGSELVSTSAFGTNSSAPQGNVKFLVEHLGVYSPEFKSDIKLKIHYATQEEFDSLQSQVDALDGNFATDEELSQAVSDLQAEIDADVLVEQQRAESEESRIETKLDQEINDRQIAVSMEESARISGDSQLQSNLESEVQNRTSEVTRLEGLISDEETRALAEEMRLEGLISDEEASRISDVSSLQNQINDIISNTDPAALDSLTEIVSAFQSADSDLSAAITSAIGQHQTELQAFKDEINPKVSTLESEMDSVEGRATTLEGEMNAAEGRLGTVEFKVFILENEMDGAESDISGLRSDVDFLSERADIINGRTTTLESEMDAAEGRLGTVEPKVFILENEMDGAQSDISGLRSDVDFLSERADITNGRTTTLESEMDAVEGRLDVIEGDSSVEGSIAKAQSDAQSYTNFEISSLQTSVSAEIDADVLVEQQRAEGEESRIEAKVDQETSDRQSADNTLQDNIDVEKARIDAILNASEADKDSFAEIVTLINSVDTENDNAFAGYVLSNDARVLAVEGEVDVLQGEMDAVEGRLDTVDPKVTTLESEMDTAQSDISTLQSGLSQEIQDRTDADNALDGRVQVLESVTWNRDIFVVSQTDVDNGYVDFSFEVVPGSVMGFVDRLGIHEGEDFTLSTEGGVTRMTFAGDLVSIGETSLAVGDRLYMSYQYKA